MAIGAHSNESTAMNVHYYDTVLIQVLICIRWFLLLLLSVLIICLTLFTFYKTLVKTWFDLFNAFGVCRRFEVIWSGVTFFLGQVAFCKIDRERFWGKYSDPHVLVRIIELRLVIQKSLSLEVVWVIWEIRLTVIVFEKYSIALYSEPLLKHGDINQMVQLNWRQDKLVCVFHSIIIKLMPKIEDILRFVYIPWAHLISGFTVLIEHQEIASIRPLVKTLSHKVWALLLPWVTCSAPGYVKLKLFVSFLKLLFVLNATVCRLLILTDLIVYLPVIWFVWLVEKVFQPRSHCHVENLVWQEYPWYLHEYLFDICLFQDLILKFLFLAFICRLFDLKGS